jgi:hypothetical protein
MSSLSFFVFVISLRCCTDRFFPTQFYLPAAFLTLLNRRATISGLVRTCQYFSGRRNSSDIQARIDVLAFAQNVWRDKYGGAVSHTPPSILLLRKATFVRRMAPTSSDSGSVGDAEDWLACSGDDAQR